MFELNRYGELVIDKILFEASYPILFTCVNDKEDLFLVVCCQNNKDGKKWLLTQTREKIIIDMLEDKISIREAFLKNSESQITVLLKEKFEVREHCELDWGENSIYLPKKGEYMDADPGEFDEEIDYYQRKFESKLSMLYHKPFVSICTYENISEIFAEDIAILPDNNGNMVNTSIKLKHRLNKSKKISLHSELKKTECNYNITENEDDFLAA